MGSAPEFDDGLIGPPPARPLGAWAFVGVWFLLLTGGLGAWDALDPPHLPDPIGQEGVHFFDRRQSARIDDGTRMRIVDEDLERRSNLKSSLTPWYAGALLRTFDEAGDEVVVGQDGWLFLVSRVHPPLGEFDQISTVWANAFEALERQLARRDSHLVVMPIPTRAVVCRERLPDGFDPGPGLWSPFCEALLARGVDTIDLQPAFAVHAPDTLYYREDSHWTRHAQFVAARAAREHLGTLVNDDRWAARLTGDERAPDKQGLLAFAGLPIGTPARDVWFPADESLARAPLQRRVGKAVGPPHAPLALIGTSYSVGEHFLAYLRVLGTTAVRNGARKGFPVHDSLRIDLRQPQRPSPVVLVEMMTYAMGPNLEHEGVLSFMGNQFGFLSALEGRRGPSILPEGSITDRPSGADVRRLSLDAGKLLTTADGIVSLRLQRPEPSLPDAPASAWNVVVRGGDLAWGVRWPADAPTFHIPLIGSRSGAHGYTVDLLGPGAHALDPNDVRVVLEHDLQAAAALTGDPLEVTPSGDRIQWFPMAATGPLGDDLALDYRQGNWAGDVRFEWVEAEGAAPVQIASAYLEARGRAVLDLAPFRSRTWSGLRVTTTNVEPGPGRVFEAHASLVPLLAE